MAHLGKQEAEPLYWYLSHEIRGDIEEWRDPKYGSTEDYPGKSSFGRDLKTIKRNAREHLRACATCRAEYEIIVKGMAAFRVRMIDFAKQLQAGKGLTIREMNKTLEEGIKEGDLLGVLRKK